MAADLENVHAVSLKSAKELYMCRFLNLWYLMKPWWPATFGSLLNLDEVTWDNSLLTGPFYVSWTGPTTVGVGDMVFWTKQVPLHGVFKQVPLRWLFCNYGGGRTCKPKWMCFPFITLATLSPSYWNHRSRMLIWDNWEWNEKKIFLITDLTQFIAYSYFVTEE